MKNVLYTVGEKITNMNFQLSVYSLLTNFDFTEKKKYGRL